MKKIIMPLAALPFLCGCAGLERPLSDVASGAGGAYLGNRVSGGDPIATAGGAGGGVLLSEGVHALNSRNQKKAYNDGYSHGAGDTVRQLYWKLQDQQRTKSDPESYRLYEVLIPEHLDEDGVLLKPTTRVIRIQE